MAQLIQMRNRIKAVTTIKKMTHAMRLIAMSTHARLQEKQPFIQQYKNNISRLFASLHIYDPSWKSPILTPKGEHHHLVIIVGSQKGMCGNFNENLFRYFEKTQNKSHPASKYEVIAVGEKAVDYCTQNKLHIINTFREFSTNNLQSIADAIASFLMDGQTPYNHVLIFNNFPKTFFVQKPCTNIIIPTDDITSEKDPIDLQDYVWEQTPAELLNYLVHVYLKTSIEYSLFESLLAEQSARFISMDSSTRNAKDILEELQLEYNKTRQSKITRELAELMGSF